MKSSFSKRAVAVILSVMMVFSMVPMMAFSASAETTGTISTMSEFKTAITNSGTYVLDTNLTLTEDVNVPSNLKLVSNNGATITCKTGIAFVLANENATLEMTNITLDGANTGKWAITSYTGNGGKNPNNVITLNDCTVQNFVGYSYVGAINAFGSCTTNLNNCTFTNNTSADPDSPYSGGDVWAGAAATVNVNGGTYGEMYLNAGKGGAGTAKIEGGATVGTLNIGVEGTNVPTYTVSEDSTVTDVVVEGINDNHNVAIGAAGYDTLEAALAAANDGDVITSVSPEYQVTTAIKTAKNVTLDGFTFNMTSYQRNPLVMTGTDVAVKNCTFTGSFYNAIETTQSKTAPLNSLTVEGCTFDAGRNNSVNVFSFVDGAKVNVSNNTFNCGDDCEAIRISNYTNAQNVSFTVDNNTYAPQNGDTVTQWDAFILFQDTTNDNTTDFTGINVAVTNLNTTSANPLYAACDKPCNDTTATVETMVTKDSERVDLRTLQAQVVLADGMVGIKVVGDNVTIDGTAVTDGTLYLTPAQAADFDKEYAIVADGVTGTFTMNGYINALTDENAKTALKAFEVYAKAAANVFSGGSYEVTSTYDFSTVDATPTKDDIYCGVSIDCSSKTQLIVYADGVAAGTAVKVNGQATSIVTVDCGSNSHTAIIVPVNSINTPVTIEVDGKTITYSVKQASKLLSGVSGYEVLAAALANYGDALVAYTA